MGKIKIKRYPLVQKSKKHSNIENDLDAVQELVTCVQLDHFLIYKS